LAIYCFIFGNISLGTGSKQLLFNDISIPYLIILILALFIAYSVGVFLNGIQYIFSRKLWKKYLSTSGNLQSESECLENIKKLTSYKYDSIQLYFPRVGYRIAKLRAERSFCRVLFSGFALLFIIYGIFPPIGRLELSFLATELLFLVAFIIFYFLYKHRSFHAAESIRNNWLLLQEALDKKLVEIK
jgi:hypothetical protein